MTRLNPKVDIHPRVHPFPSVWSAGCGERAPLALPHPQQEVRGGGRVDRLRSSSPSTFHLSWIGIWSPRPEPGKFAPHAGHVQVSGVGIAALEVRSTRRKCAPADLDTARPPWMHKGTFRPGAARMPVFENGCAPKRGQVHTAHSPFMRPLACMRTLGNLDDMRGNSPYGRSIIASKIVSIIGYNIKQGYIRCVIETMSLGRSHSEASKSGQEFLSRGAR